MDGGDAVAPAADADEMDDGEVRAAIGALTPADMVLLDLAERRYRGGTDFADGGLLQEAFCKALTRERRCRRTVGFVRTLAMMMRSIGEHRRRELARQVPLDAPSALAAGRSPGPAPIDVLASDRPDPEQAMIDGQRTDAVEAMMSLFEDDEKAQLVIMGASEGLRGAALRDETGLSSNEVHYAFRKIRNKLGPDPYGWMP